MSYFTCLVHEFPSIQAYILFTLYACDVLVLAFLLVAVVVIVTVAVVVYSSLPSLTISSS